MRFSDVNNMAASICGMKPAATVQNNPQTTLAPGPWYEYQYRDSEGLVIDCHLEYEAAEKQSHDSPGHGETMDLIYALVNGIDIAEVLSDDVKGLIEEEALTSMEMDKWNGDYDRGEERAHDRAECEA